MKQIAMRIIRRGERLGEADEQLDVDWLRDPDAPEQVVDLCKLAELESSSFPSLQRMRTLLERNPEIVVGVHAGIEGKSDRTLVGVAVLFPITRETVSRLLDGRIDSGKQIGVNEIRGSWRRRRVGDDLYVSVLVAMPRYRNSTVEAAARVLAILQGSHTAFARASTPGGRAVVKRLGFTPVPATRNAIWARSSVVPPRVGLTFRRAALATYDKRLRVISAGLKVLRPLLYGAYTLALIMLVWSALSPGPIGDATVELFSLQPSQVTPVMTTAATLGGLALTVMFLTAQLRLSGIHQYGMTAIFRVRDVTPLIGLTGVTVVSGAVVLVLSDQVPLQAVAIAGGVAVMSDIVLILFIIMLSVELIRNLDPVAVARRFAQGLRGSHADEWGLVQVQQGTGERLSVALRSHRTNFGLRDPLMPIHEIHLVAVQQRYGQIVGVLAEQVARAYGCSWEQQFPDSGSWSIRRQSKRVRLAEWWRSRRIRRGPTGERERLQLAMLILHYLVRIHRNEKLEKGAEDYRRQSVLFVMSRLIVVLATGIRPSRVSEEESNLLLQLCLDVVLRVGSDFARVPKPGRLSAIRPRIENELFHAFPAAIAALASNGFARLSVEAAQTARWLMNSESIARSRLPGFEEGVRDYPYLVRILRDEASLSMPDYVTSSPWGVVIPEPDPSRNGW